MTKVCRCISPILAACILSHVCQQASAQDICNLEERVVELLSTIDACAATGDQLAELELVRQHIVEPYIDTDCAQLQGTISELEQTIPRRPAGRPTTLDQPVPICEATQRSQAGDSAALIESPHE